MHIIQEHSKDNLIKRIQELDKNTRELYINMRPSANLIMLMTENLPNLQILLCPPSLLGQTSTRVFRILKKKGIEIKENPIRVGRPMVHKDKTVNSVLELRTQGVSAAKISEQLEIPLRTVYYYLKNKA